MEITYFIASLPLSAPERLGGAVSSYPQEVSSILTSVTHSAARYGRCRRESKSTVLKKKNLLGASPSWRQLQEVDFAFIDDRRALFGEIQNISAPLSTRSCITITMLSHQTFKHVLWLALLLALCVQGQNKVEFFYSNQYELCYYGGQTNSGWTEAGGVCAWVEDISRIYSCIAGEYEDRLRIEIAL